MKKYLPFLFVFALFIILLDSNANSASAQVVTLPEGCSSTSGYSVTTGMPCSVSTNLPAGCTSIQGYSPTTGQPCSSSTGDGSSPACGFSFVFTRDLSVKLKSRGEDVRILQQFLQCEDYNIVKIDGKYGPKTANAVGDFQDDNELARTRVVDQPTRDVLNRLLGGGNQSNGSLPVFNSLPDSGLPGTKVTIHGSGFNLFLNDLNAGQRYELQWREYTDRHSFSVLAKLNSWDIQHFIKIGKLRIINDNEAIITIPNLPSRLYSLSLMVLRDNGGVDEINFPFTVTSGNFPPGCTSNEGYSSTTGLPCSGTTNTSVVIDGISGPQTLKVNEQGTWTVKAHSNDQGNFTYAVNWGEVSADILQGNSVIQLSSQSATFTHSYSKAGNYTPKFTVTNASGQSAQTSISVMVGDATNTPTPAYISSVLPEGCTSASGYNSLTGESCGQARFGWKVHLYGSGFRYGDTTVNTYSSTTGNLVQIPISFISSSHITFVAPSSVGTGNHGLIYTDHNTGVTSNTVSLIFTDPNTPTTQPSITVLSPNGGERWVKGTTQTIKWQNTNNASTQEIILFAQDPLSTRVIAQYTIANTQGSSYNWQVGKTLDGSIVPDNSSYGIKVCNTGTSFCGVGNNLFEIVSPTTQLPQITNFTVKKLVNGNFVDVPSKEFLKSSSNSDTLQFNWSVAGTIPPEYTQLNGRYKFTVAIRPAIVDDYIPTPIPLVSTSNVTASTLSSTTVTASLGSAPYGSGQTFVVCLIDRDNIDLYCDGAMLGTYPNPKATIENVTISSSSGSVLGASNFYPYGCDYTTMYSVTTGKLCSIY